MDAVNKGNVLLAVERQGSVKTDKPLVCGVN